MAPMSPSLTWLRRLSTTKTTKLITRQTRAMKTTINPLALFLMAVFTTCLLFDQVAAAKGKSEDMLRDVAEISAEIDLRDSWFSLLERLKRENSDQEPQLLRRKRAMEETGETTFDEQLLEERHEFFVNDEMELSRQKRDDQDDEDISEEALSRVKRNDDDAQLSNTEDVVLEKGVHDVSEKELSRQKRNEEETEELGLSQQKRVEQKPEEVVLSRQKRTENEPELSREKRAEEEAVSSHEERSVVDTQDQDEKILSRQKRRDTDEKELSRQKRTDGTEEEEELSRMKRVKRELSDPQDPKDSFVVSSADQLLNSPSEDEELSRQKRHDDSSEEKILLRKKRRLLQFSEENLDESRSHSSKERTSSSKASSKEGSAKHSEILQKDKKGEPPEHRNYHEDLLQRRMKVVKMENKRRKRGKTADIDPEDEDGWEQELRIRRELAEKAIEYGIQQRKERMKNPELYGRELSILQRIKQDAEEILRRRKEEAKTGKKPLLTDTSLFKPEATDMQGENEEEVQGERKGKKKTAKAIRNLLNLGKGGKKGGTSGPKHSLPEQPPQEIQGNQDTSELGGFNPYAADNVLRFEKSQRKGKRGKGNRKKRKQGR